jgi:hypothetical protein
VNDRWPDFRTIPARASVAVFVWFTLPASVNVPTRLLHRVTFAPDTSVALLGGDAVDPWTVQSEAIGVGSAAATIAPPLRGGPWKCANGLGPYNAHTQAVTFDRGAPVVSQRFACDFQRVDSGGNILPSPFPDAITNKMFYGYGAEVLAVADGVIAALHDGVPENTPRADGRIEMPVSLSATTIAGNWIALKLKDGSYALYAHLQPLSLRVRAGQRVRAGDVLALLGNSGNAAGPHLHFQLSTEAAFNIGSGAPYRIGRDAIVRAAADVMPAPFFTPTEGTVLVFKP